MRKAVSSQTRKLCVRESWQCAVACAVLCIVAGLAVTFVGHDDIIWDIGKILQAVGLILLIALPTMLISGIGAALIFWALIFWSKLFSFKNRKEAWGTPRTPYWTLGIVIVVVDFIGFGLLGTFPDSILSHFSIAFGLLAYLNYLIIVFYYIFGYLIWENIWKELIVPSIMFVNEDLI